MTPVLMLLALAMTKDVESLPLDDAVVHRPAKVAEREALAVLPKISLIAEKPAKTLLKLARQATDAPTKVRWAKPLYLLAAGPMLDSPDRVQVHSLTARDGKIVLEVRYTSARLSGMPLRRNVRWRPLVQVPVEASPGPWMVVAKWTPYSDLAKGTSFGKATIDKRRFEVEGAQQDPK